MAGSEGPWAKAGVLIAIFTVILTYIGLAVPNHWPPFHVKASYQPVSSTSTGGPGTQSGSRNSTPVSSAQLSGSLLGPQELGQAAKVQARGTSLSDVQPFCGGSLNGDTATAYEAIINRPTSSSLQILDESIIAFNSAALAGQSIQNDRQAIKAGISCSITSNGLTVKYGPGDYAGVPPSNCANPGQFFATSNLLSGSGLTLNGYTEEAQCGAITVSVEGISNTGTVTRQTVYQYLSDAIGNLP